MKTLDTEFHRYGFHFRQLMRTAGVVLLEKFQSQWQRRGFEVCILRHCPDRIIAGKFIHGHESLPPSESWGTYGWTFTSLDAAKAKFQKLVGSSARRNGRHSIRQLQKTRPTSLRGK